MNIGCGCPINCHCEERSDVAIYVFAAYLDIPQLAQSANINFGISQKYHSHEVFGKTKRRGRATNGAMSLRFVITKKCDARHRIPLVRMTGLEPARYCTRT